jgi:cyclic di-GMP phosphodiesterase Gmr
MTSSGTSPLLALSGSSTVRWSIRADEDVLQLNPGTGCTQRISVATQDAVRVRALAGRADNLTLTVQMGGTPVTLFVTGQKVDENTWAGLAAHATDLDSIIKMLEENITFAEQVVSEVNSLVVIIDRYGRLKRFNRLCEEMSGLRESDLIGKDALGFLVSPEEASMVRGNLDLFFKKLTSYETERTVQSKNGPILVKWRNKLVKTGSEDQWFLVCSGTDISEERRAKEAEAKQERFMQNALEMSPNGIIIKALDGQYLYANAAARRLIGVASEVLGSINEIELYGEETARLIRTYDQLAQSTQAPVSFEFALERDGARTELLVKKSLLVQADGKTVILTALSDLSDIRSAERALQDSENLHRSVVASINSGIVLTDEQGRLVAANPAAERMLEIDVNEARGEPFAPGNIQASSGDMPVSLLSDLSAKPVLDQKICVGAVGDDGRKWLNYSREPLVRDGENVPHAVLHTFDDVTAEHEAQERLQVLANTDTLTGLPNRHAMQERIAALLARQEFRPFGVLFLDLDNFKTVNDHFGHAQGDELIKLAARKIQACLAPKDVLSRIGGDEFLIIVDHPTSLEELEALSRRILERMKTPFRLDVSEVYSTCSIGIALCPDHGTTREELIRNADTAMYVAKDAGKHTYRVYRPEMNNRVKEYVWLDTNFRKALEESQFELHYQPKINTRTGALAGVEALVRWRSPERGLISPASFIPYAEESGLIVQMGRWVLETAADQAREWVRKGWNIRVAVNLSARQLRDMDVLNDLARVLDKHPEVRPLLDVELTESMLVEDEAMAVTLIGGFRALGAEVHLDDFGTGFSSLSQLARLPMDVIKMDRSFINSVHNDSKARALVRTIAAVAKELDVKIVAEGVETEEQAAFLNNINVDYVQGYLYAKPLPAHQFEQWLKERQAGPESQATPAAFA